MSNNIEGKVVVITGASSGMGAAAARHLAAHGASVVLGARRVERLEALAGDITAAGGTALVVETDVNLRGEHYGIAAALPHMKAQKSGHIINLASVAGHKLFGGSAVYSATKFGVRALSEGLRMEVKPYNIRTTIISPGAVKTELLDHISEADVQQANRDYVGQVGVPADSFARVVAFAISQPDELDINEILFRPTCQEL